MTKKEEPRATMDLSKPPAENILIELTKLNDYMNDVGHVSLDYATEQLRFFIEGAAMFMARVELLARHLIEEDKDMDKRLFSLITYIVGRGHEMSPIGKLIKTEHGRH